MDAVALVSGGKDSIHSIFSAEIFGYSVKAIAHLIPLGQQHETDSYMYQSVGSNFVPKIAEALNLPIYLHEIKGTPKQIDTLNYSSTEGDEVEDLEILLRKALDAHPSIKAVTCGAILSDYQRLRCEAICQRMGLLLVAPLWNRGQVELIREMIDTGLRAALAKCACMGLKEETVGQTIEELEPLFMKLRGTSGMFVCGEGGEYETVTLESPLMPRGVSVEKGANWRRHVHHACDIAPAVLLIDDAPQLLRQEGAAAANKCFPRVLNEYVSLLGYVRDAGLYQIDESDVEVYRKLIKDCAERCEDRDLKNLPALPQGVWINGGDADGDAAPATANLCRLEPSPWFEPPSDLLDAADPLAQARDVFTRLGEWAVDLSPSATQQRAPVYVEIHLADMAEFATVNGVYLKSAIVQRFQPARACVETLFSDKRAKLRARAICLVGPPAAIKDGMKNLHVQSVSTWATACVGPYSQLVAPPCATFPEIDTPPAGSAERFRSVFVAGTIGLLPHNLAVPKFGFKDAEGVAVNVTETAVANFSRMQHEGRFAPEEAFLTAATSPQWYRDLVASAASLEDPLLSDAVAQLALAARSIRLVLQKHYGKRDGDGASLPRHGHLAALLGGMILVGSKRLAADGEERLHARMSFLRRVLVGLCLADFNRASELEQPTDGGATEALAQVEEYTRTEPPCDWDCETDGYQCAISTASMVGKTLGKLPFVSSCVVGTLPKDVLVEIMPFACVDSGKFNSLTATLGVQEMTPVPKTFSSAAGNGVRTTVSFSEAVAAGKRSNLPRIVAASVRVPSAALAATPAELLKDLTATLQGLDTASASVWIFADRSVEGAQTAAEALAAAVKSDCLPLAPAPLVTPVSYVTDGHAVEVVIQFLHI